MVVVAVGTSAVGRTSVVDTFEGDTFGVDKTADEVSKNSDVKA